MNKVGSRTDENGLTSTMPSEDLATSSAVFGNKPKSIDDIMKVTAPVLDLYGNQKDFKISDNTVLYEIVKVVKDIIDTKFYSRGDQSLNFSFAIDVRNRCVIFKMTFDGSQNKNDSNANELTTPMDQASSIADLIQYKIERIYSGTVDVERQINPITDDNILTPDLIQLSIIVREKE
jgi:hypothetical protein